jgi:hypothetical protein
MIAYALVSLLLIAALIRFTLVGRDGYPFSHYPMFSSQRAPNSARVFQLVTEDRCGQRLNWSQLYPLEALSVSRQLQLCLSNPDKLDSLVASLRPRQLVKLQIYRCCIEANGGAITQELLLEREIT